MCCHLLAVVHKRPSATNRSAVQNDEANVQLNVTSNKEENFKKGYVFVVQSGIIIEFHKIYKREVCSWQAQPKPQVNSVRGSI